jgi:hypothetical protein
VRRAHAAPVGAACASGNCLLAQHPARVKRAVDSAAPLAGRLDTVSLLELTAAGDVITRARYEFMG